jgi:hypothetical protein
MENKTDLELRRRALGETLIKMKCRDETFIPSISNTKVLEANGRKYVLTTDAYGIHHLTLYRVTKEQLRSIRRIPKAIRSQLSDPEVSQTMY